MFSIYNKYNQEVKIYAETIEDKVVSQIYNMANSPLGKDVHIRIMPDCLSEDTEVLTPIGFKLITSLNHEDRIANYNPISKEILAERIARYEITKHIPLDRLEEICQAERDGKCVVLPCKIGELHEMISDLLTVGEADSAETYTTGYRNGYRNGRIELLRYILSTPDGTSKEAEAALKEANQC